MRFVFWVPRPSIHVRPLANALVNRGHDVVVVADAPPLAERAALGAAPVAESGVREVVAPDQAQRASLLKRGPESFHYFAGLGVYDGVSSTLAASTPGSGTRAVFMESLRPGLVRGPLRRAVYFRRWYENRTAVDCFLAAGQDAVAQTRQMFGHRVPVHEFAYFVNSPTTLSATSRSPKVNIGFVGQLVDRKNVQLLIRAMARLDSGSLRLNVVGTGSQRDRLRALVERLNVDVVFHGVLSNSEVPAFLALQDCLVLPSKFDGWGAVVNESLSVGTPVLVSDRVGARSLLADPSMGQVFGEGSVVALTEALRSVVSREPVPVRLRRRIMAESAARFSPAVGAEYLIRIAHEPSLVRTPPWRQGGLGEDR